MSKPSSRAYVGTVVHKRLLPRRHAFRYHVFALCLDVDEIDALSARLRLFSRNRRNIMSFFDRDFGSRGEATVAYFARALLVDAGLGHAGTRIELLCYPRLLGFAFNPLSVYFCYDAENRLSALIYEVSNTFGERRNYVIAVSPQPERLVAQTCAKQMYVSPFTSLAGTYEFHVLEPRNDVLVGVALRAAEGPVIKTHFRGAKRPLTDASIVAMVARHPLMTIKVVVAIHFEALRLWLKRVPLFAHHSAPTFAVSIVKANSQDQTHDR